jgi:two-component system, LuxR family, sensor kinase FixL
MKQNKILIVEDDPITVLHLRDMLLFRGYGVLGPASDGVQAIEAAVSEHPDLILMDVVIEGEMDGIDAAMQIQMRLDVPVVYLTASTDDANLKRAQNTDPYGYLIKPVKDYDLYSAIETALTRHRLEGKIKESEAFSSSLMNTTPIPVMVVNLDSSIRYINAAFEELTGFSSDEIVGKKPPYPWRAMSSAVEDPLSPASGKKEEHYYTKSGEAFTVEVTTVPVSRDDVLLYYMVSWVDITLRRRLEEQILDISERERIRIGHDLHDGIGQELTAVGYLFAGLVNVMRQGKCPDEAAIDPVMKQLDHAKSHVRLMAKGLSPVNMDHFGIAIAVVELCRNAERIYGITCEVDCDDLSIPDNSKATHIYYIIQESLNNSVKHGKSKNVKVVLKRRDAGLFLEVIDDGVGLPARPERAEGLGLMFMKYRADIIGGVLNVNRRAPTGTIVTCVVRSLE